MSTMGGEERKASMGKKSRELHQLFVLKNYVVMDSVAWSCGVQSLRNGADFLVRWYLPAMKNPACR